jgi:hypothetical protein
MTDATQFELTGQSVVGKLDGGIEIDETFIGAKALYMHNDKKARVKGILNHRLIYTALTGFELPQK